MKREIISNNMSEGYSIKMYQINDNEYDIVLTHNNNFVKILSTACYGKKSANYWLCYHTKRLCRFFILYKLIGKMETKMENTVLREWVEELSDELDIIATLCNRE